MTDIIVDLYKEEEEMEEAEVGRFVEKWVSDMLPRLQHLSRYIQSGQLPLGTLLAAAEVRSLMASAFSSAVCHQTTST